MKLFKKIVRFAKNNPQIVLGVAGVVAPKLLGKIIAKAGPIIKAVD